MSEFFPRYCVGMADGENKKNPESAAILDEEDEATLAAIDRGIRSADEGRVIDLEEVRQRMNRWLARSSLPKTR